MKLETLSSKLIYQGRIFDVRLDTIREDDIEYTREIIAHKGSAVIVPLFEDGTVALVRQYRHAAGGYLLEIPAGGVEEGETFAEAAARELEEEIGYRAAKVEPLTEFFVSPGFLNEKMYLFLATGLTQTAQHLDPDEIVRVVRLPLADALEIANDGRIQDAKTIVGLLLCQARL